MGEESFGSASERRSFVKRSLEVRVARCLRCDLREKCMGIFIVAFACVALLKRWECDGVSRGSSERSLSFREGLLLWYNGTYRALDWYN